MRAGNAWEVELMRKAEVKIVPATGTARSRTNETHTELDQPGTEKKTERQTRREDVTEMDRKEKATRINDAPELPQHPTHTPGRHPRARASALTSE